MNRCRVYSRIDVGLETVFVSYVLTDKDLIVLVARFIKDNGKPCSSYVRLSYYIGKLYKECAFIKEVINKLN